MKYSKLCCRLNFKKLSKKSWKFLRQKSISRTKGENYQHLEKTSWNAAQNYYYIYSFLCGSSRGGLEVEQWSNNRTVSISVDQSPLEVCMINGPMDPLCYVRPGCVLYVCVSWKTTLYIQWTQGYIIFRQTSVKNHLVKILQVIIWSLINTKQKSHSWLQELYLTALFHHLSIKTVKWVYLFKAKVNFLAENK